MRWLTLTNLTLGREDITETHVGAEDEAEDAEDHDEDILEDGERREALVPEGDDLDDGREDQRESGTADRADE